MTPAARQAVRHPRGAGHVPHAEGAGPATPATEEPADSRRPAGREGGPRSAARFQCLQTGPGEFRWRLIVGNGRCLGRSPRPVGDVRQVLDDIAYLHRVAKDASMEVTHSQGGVGWVLKLDGFVLAESAHPYGRVVEALRAADRFIEEGPKALLDPSVAISRTRTSQSRRRP